jgi:hypothetical protein
VRANFPAASGAAAAADRRSSTTPIEPDGVLDSAAGDSVCAPSATVVQVVERHIDLRVAREEVGAQIALEVAARLNRSAGPKTLRIAVDSI